MRAAVRDVWRNPYVRVLVGLAALYGLYALLAWSSPVWTAFLIGYVLAFLLHPIMLWFVRHRLGRPLGLLVIALIVAAVLGVLWLLGVQVAAQFIDLSTELPALTESLRSAPFIVARFVDPAYGEVFQRVFAAMHNLVVQITEELTPVIAGVPRWILDQLLSANTGFVLAIGVLVLSFYLIYDFGRYNRAFLRAVPPRFREPVAYSLSRVGSTVGGYVRGQLLIAAVVGTAVGVGLAIIGVPLALVIGTLTAIGNLIPFVGPILAAVPTILLALTVGWVHTLLAAGLLIAVQLLDGNVLTPMVYQRVVALDKVTVLFAVLFGAVLFGVWGALLAVPVAVVFVMLYRDVYLTSHWYQGDTRWHADEE